MYMYLEFFIQVRALFSMIDCFKITSYNQNAIKMLWLQLRGAPTRFIHLCVVSGLHTI